ncbi:hypothetical protein FSP39_021524 [Pinctada imbricata]|uniref:Calcineurin-like phosphoesterase domain-containing protein n=1 Tax=Pinctada imbricata TaxID=66713 RepID=A0AA88XGJ9_PINIB|nr:hypothetical protein FSP39_021524 [Pinctada imbricata]
METIQREIGEKTDTSTCVRIVHISDTHRHHNDIVDKVPDGDILIHSGDFWRNRYKYLKLDVDHEQAIKDMNDFFSKQPHKLKIFVGGNHEVSFNGLTREEIQDSLPSVTYLQDSSVVYKNIKIHGSPWIKSRFVSAKGFATDDNKLRHIWSRIPTDIDVLVTHMPPNGIRDLGRVKFFKSFYTSHDVCTLCNEIHYGFTHQGSQILREVVLQNVRPRLHLFGHMHSSAGIREIQDTVFSNAAQPAYRTANVFDIYKEPTIDQEGT